MSKTRTADEMAAYQRERRARQANPVICEMGGPHENCEHAAYKARTDEMIRGIQNMTQHQRDEILAKIAPPRRSSH